MKLTDRMRLIQGDAPKPSLGTLLKQTRQTAQLEQAQIATELGYSRQSISQFERDQVIPTRAVVIAWCVITAANFEELDEAHREAWRRHNGGTKRTSRGRKGEPAVIHRNSVRYRPIRPKSLPLRPPPSLPNAG